LSGAMAAKAAFTSRAENIWPRRPTDAQTGAWPVSDHNQDALLFITLVRLSRTSVADEMREEHRRRILGNDAPNGAAMPVQSPLEAVPCVAQGFLRSHFAFMSPSAW
jgi:hypothetical protein